MVEFINVHTGCKMFVDENRVEEYKAIGHTVASSPVSEKPVKKTTTKKTAKKKEV